MQKITDDSQNRKSSDLKKFALDMISYVASPLLFFGFAILYCKITNQVVSTADAVDILMIAFLFATLLSINSNLVKYESVFMKCLPSLVALAVDAVICFKYLPQYQYTNKTFILFASIIVINLIIELYKGSDLSDDNSAQLGGCGYVRTCILLPLYVCCALFFINLSEMVNHTFFKTDRYPALYMIFCVLAVFLPLIVIYNIKSNLKPSNVYETNYSSGTYFFPRGNVVEVPDEDDSLGYSGKEDGSSCCVS